MDECAIRIDRPTFSLARFPKRSTGISFDDFSRMVPSTAAVPYEWMRRYYEEVPRDAPADRYLLAARLASSNYAARVRRAVRYRGDPRLSIPLVEPVKEHKSEDVEPGPSDFPILE